MAKKASDRHKSKAFQLRLHPSLKEQLQKLSDRKLTTMTAEVIEAVRRHLEQNGLWPPSPPHP